MNCQEVKSLLADYSVENLDASEAQNVKVHLQECISCRKQLAELHTVGDMVEELESIEPPAEIWHKILTRGEDLFRTPASRRQPSPAALRWAFASAFMAILIFAFSVFFSLRYLQPQQPNIAYALPVEVSYSPDTTLSGVEMTDYLQQHAAASSQDAFFDPVSIGLVNYTTTEMIPAEE